MRTEKEINDKLLKLTKIYKKQGSVEIYRHPETEAMVYTLRWVLKEMELPDWLDDGNG